jgi:hypothetical protein
MGAAFFWDGGSRYGSAREGAQNGEPFLFSQAPAGKNLRLSAVV